ncbi:hypothetical protein [Corynebacterium sp. HMSC29G08]|uniref:hypothetical protein n=1 Tax=Corynebacterium sp. HMSC29G08 TaxID=1581069 RepID=UPI0008A5BF6D|nr:hypothetical protein [Corynebacterium sp. HMSC29G08]
MKRCTVPLLAVTLLLAGCVPSALRNDAASTPPPTFVPIEEIQTPSESENEDASKSPLDEIIAAQDDESYEDVDPELFSNEYGAVVGGNSGVVGCFVQDETLDPEYRGQLLTSCEVMFRYPLPEMQFNGGWPDATYSNVFSFDYDLGEFQVGHSPGSQGFATRPPGLEPGQRVTIYGTTFTHLHDSGFRVERDGQGVEVHNSVIQFDDDPVDHIAESKEPVDFGTQCGVMVAPSGDALAVIAVSEDTTCDTAMDVVEGYRRALHFGETQGQAAFWTSPEGWGCTGRYFYVGEEHFGANGKISCAASSPSGEPASVGNGEVVAVPFDEIDMLP